MTLPIIRSLTELEAVVSGRATTYVRYSKGPEHDGQEQSIDTESGLQLPGLSVNPLHPESWWTRPLGDWLARQVCQYRQLREKNPERFPWLLDGTVVGRGPDNEPLLVDIQAVGRLSEELLEEAVGRYEQAFRAGQGPED
ncbi:MULTISPECIES: DUF6098 family protein [Microbacterium]|uniref:DUF6098 family protein n=1 Tax=Microbacterium TaxID=33882 RepID=UPI0027E24EA8|nr:MULTISPECIES: DUF6098 family protein [Microbacterium]